MLPRRGHTKALLAQWRELEQRRKDEELTDRAAAVDRERSRRTRYNTPDQRGLAINTR